MTPAQADFRTLLDTLAASANVRDAAVADNYRFEERVSETRQEDYEKNLAEPLTNVGDWRFQHDKRVVISHIKGLDKLFVPDTFLAANSTAQLPNLAPNHELVRVEDLSFAFSKTFIKNVADLRKVFGNHGDAQSADSLARFIKEWNEARHNWPMFCALYDEVKDDAEHDDWAHRLRDRLGLDHLQSAIPVALMRYPAKLVLDAAKARRDARITAPFALPTVLDGELNHAFFPAPAGQTYGATLNLGEPWQPTQSAEILNLHIDYQPQHLWKIGEIVRPTGYRDLRAQRDQHLALVRQTSGNSGWGQTMAGRP